MELLNFRLILLVSILPVAITAYGAVPERFALLHAFVDPSTNARPGTGQGYSVAIDGNIAVAGALDSGAVKIYDATTGALLRLISNPNPSADDKFGVATAISGTRVVVGAVFSNTGGSLAGVAYVYDLAQADPLTPVLTLTNPSPTSAQNFGASVAISGTRIVVGSATDDTGAPDAGRAFVYDLEQAAPGVPMLTLDNPTPEQSDFFGNAVAISGTQVVVGAVGDNTGLADAGSVYVFDLAGATPALPMLTLTNLSPSIRGEFGFAVAISGARVAVGGAFGGGVSGLDSGKVHVYDLLGSTPTVPVLVTTNPAPDRRGYYASSVALSGPWLVVSAYRNEGSPDRGNAFVYDLTSATPGIPAMTLTNPAPSGNDQFASAVAVAGTRVLVGAFQENAGARETGIAYIFDLSSATPTQPAATLNHTSPSVTDLFGSSVSISGNRVAVGAPWDDAGATDAGVVYVYDLAVTAPRGPVLTLTNPGAATGDLFGQAVAVSGDRIVVGAPRSDTATNDSGAAYVFDLKATDPSVPIVTLTNPIHPAPGYPANFGAAVAIDGQRVVVGSPHGRIGLNYAGYVHVYDLAGTTPGGPSLTLTNPNPTGNDYFGYSVALSGTRVVVGAYGDDDGGIDAGAAYVYEVAGTTPTVPVASLRHPHPELGLSFGRSVGVSGTRVVVGGDRGPGSGASGGAYVYDLMCAEPSVPVAALLDPNPAQSDDFGHSVAISGSQVVVGASLDSTHASFAGIVYVYDLFDASPDLPVATLRKPRSAAGDQFGMSVTIDGTTIVVGAPYDDTNAPDRGAVYVFGPWPSLSIVPAAPGFATLSWTPVTSSGFVLQYADSFPLGTWSDAPSGATNPVTIPLTKAAIFHRLVQP